MLSQGLRNLFAKNQWLIKASPTPVNLVLLDFDTSHPLNKKALKNFVCKIDKKCRSDQDKDMPVSVDQFNVFTQVYVFTSYGVHSGQILVVITTRMGLFAYFIFPKIPVVFPWCTMYSSKKSSVFQRWGLVCPILTVTYELLFFNILPTCFHVIFDSVCLTTENGEERLCLTSIHGNCRCRITLLRLCKYDTNKLVLSLTFFSSGEKAFWKISLDFDSFYRLTLISFQVRSS